MIASGKRTMTARTRMMLRKATAAAISKYGCGGQPKRIYQPKPVTSVRLKFLERPLPEEEKR